MKYRVTVTQTLYRHQTVEVEADSKEDAKEATWDVIDSRPDNWYEKIQESDFHVEQVRD